MNSDKDQYYQHINFKNICKNFKYEKINPLISQLKTCNTEFNFFKKNLKTNEIIESQKGVFRTNCLDCLDRTNIFQSKIAI